MRTRDRIAIQRERLACEAARIILEQDLTDFDKVGRKAADGIGVSDRRHRPTNEALREAVLTHRRLFHDAADVRSLRRLRTAALEAMDRLADFPPRLNGGALSRGVNPASGVELLLFVD